MLVSRHLRLRGRALLPSLSAAVPRAPPPQCRGAGHSRFAKIGRAKGEADVARSLQFSKLAKAITAAVRGGGGNDPASNLRLASVLAQAKALCEPRALAHGGPQPRAAT